MRRKRQFLASRLLPPVSCPLYLSMLKDTPYGYGAVSKILHWLIALLIIANLAIGLTFDSLSAAEKMQMMGIHKSMGIAVLVLMIVRLIWRVTQGYPKMPAGIPERERILARIVHSLFYPLLIALPLAGWLMSSAGGHPVSFFGLFTLPAIWEKNKEMGEWFELAHNTFAYLTIIAVTGHVVVALFRHFVQKDKLIRRMM